MLRLVNNWQDMVEVRGLSSEGPYATTFNTYEYSFERQGIWAYTLLSTVYLVNDDDAHASFFFTEYGEIDDRGRYIHHDVSAPSNKWRLRNTIGSWWMTRFVVQERAMYMRARGVVVMEFWTSE